MKVLLVDDERVARAELRRLLAAHPEVQILGEAANAEQARDAIATLGPELLFLDVQMPGGTGFDLLASLEEPPPVIFTTAYDHHAARAFAVEAVDYLVKPVDPRRLAEAVERATRRCAGPEATAPGFLERIFVKDRERCFFVALREVPLIESEGNYAVLHLAGARPMVPRSLTYLEGRLDPAVFFRASRSHLVNLTCVEHIEPGPGGTLVVRVGGVEVEMSRRQSQRFREQMMP